MHRHQGVTQVSMSQGMRSTLTGEWQPSYNLCSELDKNQLVLDQAGVGS